MSRNHKELTGKALYENKDNLTYFDSLGVEHIPQKLENS